jgi:spermidine synthase
VARALPLLAALLSGAAGLGLEGVLLSAAGLALGHGRAGALGLSTFVAGWALGAWLAGRSDGPPRRTLLGAGLLLAVAGLGLPRAVFAVARDAPGGALATSIGLAGVLLAAVPQGALLPSLARVQARLAPGSGVALLLGCNLLGSVGGVFALGFEASAAFGRLTAAALAAGVGVIAAGLGALPGAAALTPHETPQATPRATRADEACLGPAVAGWMLGLATLWIVALEWIALRLALLWVDSLQLTLCAVLAASLLALAAGAVLAPLLPRGPRGLAWLLALMLCASSWPHCAAPVLSRVNGPFAIALCLCVPTLLPFGALAPALFARTRGESGRRLGGLFLHEAWGALAAGPLVHWGLVPWAGLGGALAWLCAVAGLIALPLARRPRAVLVAAALALGIVLVRQSEPALASPQLRSPALVLRAFAEDAHFAVSVVDDGLTGERTLLTDRFRAAGTGRDYLYMRVLGHLPLLMHPRPRSVAVVGLGTGTTLGAVARHPEVERIDVMELSDAVSAFAPWFASVNGGALADERVHVVRGDGRRALGLRPGAYDVVTLEPLLPDSPFGVYLYTEEFYAVARRALAPGGLVCQWVPPHALEPNVLAAVLDAFERSFPWRSRWLFGTQLILLGGEARPGLDPARFPAPGAPLETILGQLGLATPGGLAARILGEVPASSPGRRLTDVDPWIVYRRARPAGLEVLAWLPRNLRDLLAESCPPPDGWLLDEADLARWRAHAALREARLVLARGELELRSGATDDAAFPAAVVAALGPALEAAERDPEVAELLQELEFRTSLRAGEAALRSGQIDDPGIERLVRAAELRPERADVHLYLAAAWRQRGDVRLAQAALYRALDLCPRAFETPAGLRARAYGLTSPPP